jgi:hypothetical protein
VTASEAEKNASSRKVSFEKQKDWQKQNTSSKVEERKRRHKKNQNLDYPFIQDPKDSSCSSHSFCHLFSCFSDFVSYISCKNKCSQRWILSMISHFLTWEYFCFADEEDLLLMERKRERLLRSRSIWAWIQRSCKGVQYTVNVKWGEFRTNSNISYNSSSGLAYAVSQSAKAPDSFRRYVSRIDW